MNYLLKGMSGNLGMTWTAFWSYSQWDLFHKTSPNTLMYNPPWPICHLSHPSSHNCHVHGLVEKHPRVHWQLVDHYQEKQCCHHYANQKPQSKQICWHYLSKWCEVLPFSATGTHFEETWRKLLLSATDSIACEYCSMCLCSCCWKGGDSLLSWVFIVATFLFGLNEQKTKGAFPSCALWLFLKSHKDFCSLPEVWKALPVGWRSHQVLCKLLSHHSM